MASASASVCRNRNSIHAITEVDITEPRRIMRAHREQTGETLSLTAYVIACLAHAVADHSSLNSFRRGGKLLLLDDVNVSTLVERELGGERIPEPFGIREAQAKSFRQIHEEIRAAQRHVADGLGGLSGMRWVRFIPGFLLRAFIRAASHSLFMMRRFGTVSVTAVGMFGNEALWFIPFSGSTVAVTVGGIVERPLFTDGRIENREHLCLTISFDHDIVDGAPAARFVKSFAELLRSGASLQGEAAIVHGQPADFPEQGHP
jgi:pyruvate/2-oxoglutarate dehydrogenase complex dihydrolipoamide acyltransferase (E2) component